MKVGEISVDMIVDFITTATIIVGFGFGIVNSTKNGIRKELKPLVDDVAFMWQAIYLILKHLEAGNETKEMEEVRDKMNKYLIEKGYKKD